MTNGTQAPAPAQATKGLQNVVVGQTKLSEVNGTEGKLIYAGYDIADLADHASFEEVIFLLWHLQLPNQHQLDSLKKQLTDNMALNPAIIALMQSLSARCDPDGRLCARLFPRFRCGTSRPTITASIRIGARHS